MKIKPQRIVFLFSLLLNHSALANIDLLDNTPPALEPASVIQLIHVTSNAMEGYSNFFVTLDSNSNIQGMSYFASKENSRKDFPLSQLPAGLEFYKPDGVPVITLKSKSFNPEKGGSVDLVYLYDYGIFRKRKFGVFTIDIVRVGNNWIAQTRTPNGVLTFSTMFLQKREFLGRVIGIERVIAPAPVGILADFLNLNPS